MELREPPKSPAKPPSDRLARALLVANLVAILAVTALLLRGGGSAASGPAGERLELTREVASKLKAAGALDEAAARYEAYLEASRDTAEQRARIAYSLGTTYLDRGLYEKALRWFYEAETLGAGSLQEEVGKKIVHSLERLGRYHAAKAALDARTQLADAAQGDVQRSADDPVVARVGEQEFHKSDVARALDDMPPELARGITTADQKAQFLRQYVADELLWRKAVKLEYDADPEVRRHQSAMLRRIVIDRFIEQEVLSQIEVDEADLKNYFEANRQRYAQQLAAAAAESGQPAPEAASLSFEQLRPAVEQEYRLSKVQNAYRQLVETELATEDVELFPERWQDG